MTSITINGRPETAFFVKKIQNNALKVAESILSNPKSRDGLDTYGVKTADGQATLILLDTHQKLQKTDKVVIDGQPATVEFVENEVNTSREGVHKMFSSVAVPVAVTLGTGVGAAAPYIGSAVSEVAATMISLPFIILTLGLFNPMEGISFAVSDKHVAIGAVSGAVLGGAAVTLAGASEGAFNKPDHTITDSLSRK